MKKSLLIILSIVFTFLFVVGLTSCNKSKNKNSKPALYIDVMKIKADLTTSSMRSIYNPADFEALEKDILAGKVSRTDCYYRVREILGNYHVAHVYITPIEPDPVVLPVTFYNYGKEFHVCGVTKKYEKYLGWKLTKINGLEVDEAVDRLAEFYSYETVISKRYNVENKIPFADFKYAGLLDNKGKLHITLESSDGIIEELVLKSVNYNKNKFITLLPEIENNCLPHFVTDNYSIKPCSEKRTLYVPYLSCIARDDYPADVWFSDIIKELDSGLYDTLVFDLRYNHGGYQLTWGFPEKYRDELNKYNIALVAGGRTFSASTIFMESILEVCPNAKIFGEETGQAIFNYTGVNSEELKALNCTFGYPMFLEEISPLPELKKRSNAHYQGIMPDVEVYEKFEDFIKGEDTIYNAIYDYFNTL
ncbi:MAG: hypothetical protein K6A43_13060 [Treponema sp.]|nr:hypothetical protein [Treponema sp.]